MKTQRKISEVDLTLPLAGSEGLDINYIGRIRTQYLFAQHQALVTQTQFADAKAAALMTLVGLIALRGPFAIGEPPVSLFTGLYLALVAACILFSFLAVFPRYPAAKLRMAMAESDRWSWPALATGNFQPDDFSRFMQTSEVSQLVHSVSLSNGYVSRILLRKFLMLRIAFLFAFAVLIMTGLRLAAII